MEVNNISSSLNFNARFNNRKLINVLLNSPMSDKTKKSFNETLSSIDKLFPDCEIYTLLSNRSIIPLANRKDAYDRVDFLLVNKDNSYVPLFAKTHNPYKLNNQAECAAEFKLSFSTLLEILERLKQLKVQSDGNLLTWINNGLIKTYNNEVQKCVPFQEAFQKAFLKSKSWGKMYITSDNWDNVATKLELPEIINPPKVSQSKAIKKIHRGPLFVPDAITGICDKILAQKSSGFRKCVIRLKKLVPKFRNCQLEYSKEGEQTVLNLITENGETIRVFDEEVKLAPHIRTVSRNLEMILAEKYPNTYKNYVKALAEQHLKPYKADGAEDLQNNIANIAL